MALTACHECGTQVSTEAVACPSCGAATKRERKLSLPLGLGILFFPYLFVWFLLRKGYSTGNRVTGFAWLFVALLIIGSQGNRHNGGSDGGATASQSTQATPQQNTLFAVGQSFRTDYFEVTVNDVSATAAIDTGNQFTSMRADSGNQFLLLNITIRNIDDESRMFSDGSAFLETGGKRYEFDHPETIIDDRFSLMEQINPMVSKTINIAYKIPDGVEADAYWIPGRNSHDAQVSLGHIKK